MNHNEVLMVHKYMQNSLTQALTTLSEVQMLPGFANTSLWSASTEGEDLTTCMAAGRQRVDTQGGIGSTSTWVTYPQYYFKIVLN